MDSNWNSWKREWLNDILTMTRIFIHLHKVWSNSNGQLCKIFCNLQQSVACEMTGRISLIQNLLNLETDLWTWLLDQDTVIYNCFSFRVDATQKHMFIQYLLLDEPPNKAVKFLTLWVYWNDLLNTCTNSVKPSQQFLTLFFQNNKTKTTDKGSSHEVSHDYCMLASSWHFNEILSHDSNSFWHWFTSWISGNFNTIWIINIRTYAID